MQRKIKVFNLFLIFVFTPVIGLYIAFFIEDPQHIFDKTLELVVPVDEVNGQINKIDQEIDATYSIATNTTKQVEKILISANKNREEYEKQKNQLDNLMATSKQQTIQSDIVLEKILSNLLGEPIATHAGKNSTIKVYTLKEAGYRGYMAKIRPNTSEALQLVLADDKVVSNGEITSKAAKRTGGILAVNAGGFWRTQDGKLAPLGITVVDGKIVTFYKNPKLSFVGFNTEGHLVGGKYQTPKEVKENNILQGSSFVPTLLEDGKKMPITSDWANTKHPRTLVGNFSNNELLFIVIDGRREGWSTGVTLEEIQDKLLSFKVKDAYNLDGGGSSAFYYDGKILNKPSDERERPVTSNLVILP